MTARSCPPGTVVMAETQTAGRGRYGRTWQSPKGNLYMSLVLPDMGKNTPYIAFLTAVAVADSLPDFNVSLKWPNDVLLDGKKLAGILVERVGDKIIVGIGVNVISNPTENVLYPTASLEGRLRPMTVAKRILLQYNTLLELMELSLAHIQYYSCLTSSLKCQNLPLLKMVQPLVVVKKWLTYLLDKI